MQQKGLQHRLPHSECGMRSSVLVVFLREGPPAPPVSHMVFEARVVTHLLTQGLGGPA